MKANYFSTKTLDTLTRMEAESAEFANSKNAFATERLIKKVVEFEKACEETFAAHITKVKCLVEVDELMDEEGPFLVLMTLQGQGLGTWDGSWDHLFESDEELDKFSCLVCEDLQHFADDTGGGSLNEEFMIAAMESLDLDPEKC